MRKGLMLLALSVLVSVLFSCRHDSPYAGEPARIKNFENLKSIGYGVLKTTSSESRLEQKLSSDDVLRIIAADNTGVYSMVEFLDRNGSDVSDKMYPLAWVVVEDYVFFTVGSTGVENVADNIKSEIFYICSKKNGRVYKCDYFDFIGLNDRIDVTINGQTYSKGGLDVCGNSVYVMGISREGNSGVFRIELKNNSSDLSIEQVADFTQFVEWDGLIADKFGNIYSKDYYYSTYRGSSEVAHNSWTEAFKGMNEVVYFRNSSGRQCYMARNGEERETVSFPNSKFYIGYCNGVYDLSKYILKVEGSKKYYYNSHNNDGANIVTVNISNPDSLTYEVEESSPLNDPCLVNNWAIFSERLYSIDANWKPYYYKYPYDSDSIENINTDDKLEILLSAGKDFCMFRGENRNGRKYYGKLYSNGSIKEENMLDNTRPYYISPII